MTFLWTEALNQPPRPFDDWDPLTLQALLFGRKTARSEILSFGGGLPELEAEEAANAIAEGRAVVTGDPVVDLWERQIEQGLTPDWTADG